LDGSSLDDEVFSLRAKQIGVRSPGRKIFVDGIDFALDLIRVCAKGMDFRAGESDFDGRELEFHECG